ncbi:trp operon leader peptide [Enterobacter roggenkampii]
MTAHFTLHCWWRTS